MLGRAARRSCRRCSPGDVRALFDAACPIAVPTDVGMSLFLTSPGWLIAAARPAPGIDRLVSGRRLPWPRSPVVDLMHFSQGWVQFGYRFSNDYAPFGILLVGLALSSGGRTRKVGYVLIVALGPGEPVGRGLGADARMVRSSRTRLGLWRRSSPAWSPSGWPRRRSAGRVVLGHGRVPDRRPAARHGPPDRLSDLRDPGLVRLVVLQPLGDPAFRMNLLSAICLGVAAALTAGLVARLTRQAWLGLAAGILLATTPDRLGHRHARRPPRAVPRLRCAAAGPARRLGTAAAPGGRRHRLDR